MIKKKICMLGSFAVGKTSLVNRFVRSMFSEKYLTTVGVKIDKKTMTVKNQLVDLILWDIHGEDEFQTVQISYLRGASGYFLVVDGTRRTTVDKAYSLYQRVTENIGKVPFILLLNKADLLDEWEMDEAAIALFIENGWDILSTSAKTGEGVEEAFRALTSKMLEE
jgi:small GTP-binding protein